MSAIIFPVAEGFSEAEFFNVADWKKLARCLDAVDEAALQLRVTPLCHFVCRTRRAALQAFGEAGVRALEAEAELRDGA